MSTFLWEGRTPPWILKTFPVGCMLTLFSKVNIKKPGRYVQVTLTTEVTWKCLHNILYNPFICKKYSNTGKDTVCSSWFSYCWFSICKAWLYSIYLFPNCQQRKNDRIWKITLYYFCQKLSIYPLHKIRRLTNHLAD